jgi:peptidoglycan/xylan/chitin deacetylase (PgdA/CDA1 family)
MRFSTNTCKRLAHSTRPDRGLAQQRRRPLPSSRRTATNRVIRLAIATLLLALLQAGPRALAGVPEEAQSAGGDVPARTAQVSQPKTHTSAEAMLTAETRQPLYLTAGDDGPYFSLDDLHTYTPPPPLPISRITPPVWKEYPEELKDYPLPARSYTTETVTYLAQHEIRDGDPASSYVALTFDCETGTYSTLQILETLRNAQVNATFFVLGKYAYQRPEIVREIVADGHELGNHSFFHPLFTSISPISATQELTYTESAIARAVGHDVPMRYMRFPYGGRNNATRHLAALLGYQSAFWDMDPKGWEPDKTPQDVVSYVQRTARKGGILIMHCGCWNDARALPAVIETIRARGLIPGTLSDVLSEADRRVPAPG